ncbi:MAG: aldehyde ferredoxin oxidoreductase N-terminal domain-containing protein, partial [Thermodesulfobacteriota bacterium]|nr:aldehyde ferredoxin oxidoreductase N-terminal domain-containing protein [Thermodesulfobacteriota bacterium]
MASGYMGKVLVLDLGTREINEEEIPEAVYKKYLSGMGLGAYILYNRIPKGADPLGPDNMLGFVSGLLTATGSIITGRWMVTGKSPLTGGWGDANCGGTFSPAIKRCGYDGVFFTGISKDPVYLYIDPKGVPELKDASDLWGNDAVETEEMLIERHGKSAKVACIGPAGEKLSLISGVCNDKGRIAARSGLGALMGSKRLKALCLAGRKKIEVYDKAGMKGLTKKASDFISKGSSVPLPPGSALPYIGAMMRIMPTQMAQDGLLFKLLLQKWGTVFQNQYSIEAGDSPIKNWKGTNKDFGASKSKTTNADVFIRVQTRKYHCYSCPIGCGGICSTTGKYSETHKPEYETVLALGGLLMNDDPEMIFYLNEVLNRAGMDSISAGSTVAFAMECLENGLISASDIDGIDLTWGNTEAIIAFIEKMTAREGNIGELFADGTKKASERIGQGSDAFAIHAGGQELPMHDPRNDPGYAIHYSA